MKKRFYVVWKGHCPGLYHSWKECHAQTDGFKGAQYMSFSSLEEAKEAYAGNYHKYKGIKKKAPVLSPSELKKIGLPDVRSISVDAASSGNPGIMEYQGVDTKTGKRLFRQGPFPEGTNNIGEFLAIVHGLAYLQQHKSDRIIYTDSRTAISWVRKKKCNSKLKKTHENRSLFDLIARAEDWLSSHMYNTRIVKWETKAWGEIPADFGRK